MKIGRLSLLVLAVVALPLALYAQAVQQATLSGTVKDNTGAVLAGTYKVTAELSGFNTQTRMGVELRLATNATLDFGMTVSGVQETVQVTGEAPLLQTSTSNIASNIDPRQMQDIPINGRDW